MKVISIVSLVAGGRWVTALCDHRLPYSDMYYNSCMRILREIVKGQFR